ncbi:MAG TPA: amidohydrolase family protein [Gaiellales bacterium]|nr:amidohydrolase family protein [Gaiellales bacterium]
MLDLRDIPVVDNHCHGVFASAEPITVNEMRHRFSECAGEPFPSDHTATAAHYLWALGQVAEVLGCEPSEEAVVAARAARTRDDLDRLFLQSAGIAWLLVDDGYPDPATVSSREELAARLAARVGWVERVEAVAARLVGEHQKFAAFDEALRAHLGAARDRGVCGLKSVAAYRSGLAVSAPERADAKAAFKRTREAPGFRVQEKPLVDHIVMRSMEAAATQELPVQFHTGYGDSDADLLLADPLHLAPLLRRFPSVAVVMLHAAYPYTRKLAILAATYPNAYVDVSYAIPFLTARELHAVTHEALGAAPASRVLYSSDAVGLPEQHWLGAVRGRRALGAALGDMVMLGDLGRDDARRMAHLVLHENAERIYGLPQA